MYLFKKLQWRLWEKLNNSLNNIKRTLCISLDIYIWLLRTD